MHRTLGATPRVVSDLDSTFTVSDNCIHIYELAQLTQSISINSSATCTSYVLPKLWPPYDQGLISDCMAYVIRHQLPSLRLSRQHLYDMCRRLDGVADIDNDSITTTTIKTACQAIEQYGTCQESDYPTNNHVEHGQIKTNQTKKLSVSYRYMFIPTNSTTMSAIRVALLQYKVPLMCVIAIYDSFLTASVATNGVVPMPKGLYPDHKAEYTADHKGLCFDHKAEYTADHKGLCPDHKGLCPDHKADTDETNTNNKETLYGYHCVSIIGYNDATRQVLCMNTWGTDWGHNGSFYLPYDFVENPMLTHDITILLV
jgi:hypothetical protein